MSETAIVAPQGEVDLATVGALRESLGEAAAAEHGALIVDLTEVSFIDSTGLGAVIEAGHRARRAGRRFAVVAPHGSAPAVTIGLSGLRGALPVFDTRAEATAAG